MNQARRYDKLPHLLKETKMNDTMKPFPLACSCGEPLSVMRLPEDRWAIGHLDRLESEGIVASSLEEAVRELAIGGDLECCSPRLR